MSFLEKQPEQNIKYGINIIKHDLRTNKKLCILCYLKYYNLYICNLNRKQPTDIYKNVHDKF